MTSTTNNAVLPQELQAPILLSDGEVELVAGGFNWGAFAFVGSLALGASGGNPLVAIGAGVIAGFVTK
jgi:hypothetical protein